MWSVHIYLPDSQAYPLRQVNLASRMASTAPPSTFLSPAIHFTQVWINTYTYTFIHIHVYMFIDMYTYIHVCVYKYVCRNQWQRRPPPSWVLPSTSHRFRPAVTSLGFPLLGLHVNIVPWSDFLYRGRPVCIIVLWMKQRRSRPSWVLPSTSLRYKYICWYRC